MQGNLCEKSSKLQVSTRQLIKRSNGLNQVLENNVVLYNIEVKSYIYHIESFFIDAMLIQIKKHVVL